MLFRSGTNERFARANVRNAEVKVYNDNVTIFDEIAKGDADLMITDSSETRYQQKLHPGVLCAVHPDRPFDFAEKGYWMQRDPALKDFEADNFDIAMGGISITLDRQKKGMFSAPIMREGKTPIARCSDKEKYETIADIDKQGTRVIVNPGGTNERFARANVKNAEIKVYNDNVTIFDEIAKGNADLMMTDASETRFQQKLHAGVLCAVHPDKQFDFSEKAYWLQRDAALKAFVDQWLHISMEDGTFKRIFATWFE